MRKSDDPSATTYDLRSSVLGGQVVAEIGWASVSWQWARGYVYAGSQLLAVQQNGVYLVHEDAVSSSRVMQATETVSAVVLRHEAWLINHTEAHPTSMEDKEVAAALRKTTNLKGATHTAA